MVTGGKDGKKNVRLSHSSRKKEMEEEKKGMTLKKNVHGDLKDNHL